MNNWWDLGEDSGVQGNGPLKDCKCPFCKARGNFEVIFQSAKKKPNGEKTLNYQVFKCANCGNLNMVVWSTPQYGYRPGIYDYRQIPYPLKEVEAPSHWPEDVSRYWKQSIDCLNGDILDAAVLMARSALQCAVRSKGSKGKNLKEEIDSLKAAGELPNVMTEWSHELRLIGNESAHPNPGAPEIQRKDVLALIKFLNFLCTYLYDLPHDINNFRKNRNGD